MKTASKTVEANPLNILKNFTALCVSSASALKEAEQAVAKLKAYKLNGVVQMQFQGSNHIRHIDHLIQVWEGNAVSRKATFDALIGDRLKSVANHITKLQATDPVL